MKHLANLKKPICIFSSERVGSHLLEQYLIYNCPGYKRFGEVFNEAAHTPDFSDQIWTMDKFVWLQKANHLNINNFNEISQLMSRSYIIKLERKDVAKQIASYYVQTFFGWNPPKAPYSIMVQKHFMELCIKDVLQSNQIVKKLDKFNEKMFFEDVVAIDNTTNLKSSYAKNYTQLVQAVHRVWRSMSINFLNESLSIDSVLNTQTKEFIDSEGKIRIEGKLGTIR